MLKPYILNYTYIYLTLPAKGLLTTIQFIMYKRKQRHDKVYQQGQFIIKALAIAAFLVRSIQVRNSDLTMKETLGSIEMDIMSCIIGLASVCSGNDGWDSVCRYISEAGVTLPEKLHSRMQYFSDNEDME